jgi:hypothetical protein
VRIIFVAMYVEDAIGSVCVEALHGELKQGVKAHDYRALRCPIIASFMEDLAQGYYGTCCGQWST